MNQGLYSSLDLTRASVGAFFHNNSDIEFCVREWGIAVGLKGDNFPS